MIDSIPVEELNGTEPLPETGKRRGRPPLTDAQKAARNEKDRQRRASKGKPSRGPRKAPARTASLKTEIEAFLTMGNMLVVMSPLGTRPATAIYDPTIPTERIGDELDAAEIAALASALDAQCRRSPRFKRYVEMVLGAGAGGQLVTILGLIATRRAARHGLIPNGQAIDFALGMVIANGDVSALTDFTPPDETPSGPDAETGETAPAPLPDAGFDFDRN